jgi:pimeloyl-ACP methyl ester carboxylesterase
MMPKVAIVIPGIMGSVLELNGTVIWPGPLSSLVLRYSKMKELMREDLVPTDCIRNYFITSQYQQLIDDLETCGFREGDKTLVVAAYDWRKDNADSAKTLAKHIDDTVDLHGPSSDISLIGHSMGGLVGRYYLESGNFSNRAGFKCVRRLITFGTPHQGAAIALPLVLGYERSLFLSKDQVLQTASDERYPAAYQLLPPKGEPFAWDGSTGAELGYLNIYDPDVASKLGLVEANLQAAQRFHASLDLAKRPADTRYFCFTGTRQTTATHIMVRPLSSNRFQPVKTEKEDGGDGTVPTWSSFLIGLQRMFVGGEHGTLYHNRSLRRALGTLLGKEGYLRGVPVEVEVALREKVVEPQDFVHVAITFDAGIQDFSGILTIERARINQETEQVEGFGEPDELHPVEYKGLGLETMSLVFEAPNIRGVYRVAFRDEVDAAPSGFDELIVQTPPTP